MQPRDEISLDLSRIGYNSNWVCRFIGKIEINGLRGIYVSTMYYTLVLFSVKNTLQCQFYISSNESKRFETINRKNLQWIFNVEKHRLRNGRISVQDKIRLLVGWKYTSGEEQLGNPVVPTLIGSIVHRFRRVIATVSSGNPNNRRNKHRRRSDGQRYWKLSAGTRIPCLLYAWTKE